MTTIQLSLDQALAQVAQTDALQRVAAHADQDWTHTAYLCVVRVAREHDEFTTDHVLAELANYPVSTHEPRALGPVMMRAARDSIIATTGRFVKSAAVSRHRAPKQVWKSLLRVSA